MELLDRLYQHHFLAVIGVSGSGKSSLVRAGLLPSLRKGFISDAGYRWRTIVLRPGPHPMESLWGSLVRSVIPRSLDSNKVQSLKEQFDLNSRSLIEIGKEFLGTGQRAEYDENLLVVVDQFEEVFTLVGSRDESVGEDGDQFEPARAFVDRLMKASQQSEVPIYVVITMRSDYLGDCARFRDFPELLNGTQYLIPRMTVSELVDAIVRPAKLGSPAGDVERQLVNRLLNDFNDEPRNLPRLQHALAQTWEEWMYRTAGDNGDQKSAPPSAIAQLSAESLAELSLKDYQRAGGFDHALDKHAERLFEGLSKGRQQDIAELIFKRITAQDVSNRLVRCSAALWDIYSLVGCKTATEELEIQAIIKHFLDDHVAFLTSPNVEDTVSDPTGSDAREVHKLPNTAIIDITHESLIYGWQRLAKWVRQEATSAGQYQRLVQNARDHRAGIRGWLQAGELEYFEEFRSNATKGWSEAWSKRYNLVTESAQSNSDWKDAEDFLQGSKSHLWWLRLEKVAIFAALAALLSAFAVIFVFARTKRAEDYASQSEYERAQLGAKTQERAALLKIESFKIQARPSNTDLAAWETFDRITPGIPLPTKDKQLIDRLFLVPDSEGKGRDMFRVVALSVPPDLAEGLRPLAIRSDTDSEDQNFLQRGRYTAVSSSGRFVATPCNDRTVTIFGPSGPNSTESWTVPCTNNLALIVEPSRAGFSSESSRIATVEYRSPKAHSSETIIGSIRVVDIRGHNKPVFERDNIALLNEAISKDGRYLAFVEKEATGERATAMLRLVDLTGRVETRNIHGISIDAPLDFSPDGRLLGVGMADGKITIIDLQNQSQVILNVGRHSPLKTSYPISALAFSNKPETSLLAYSEDGHDNVVRVVSYSAGVGNVDGRLRWSDYFGRKVSHLTFSPTDDFLGLAVGESTARVKIAATGFETARVVLSDRATWIAFSPNPKDNLAFSSAANGQLVKFTTNTAESPDVEAFDCPNPQEAALGDRGKLVAVSCLAIQTTTKNQPDVAPITSILRFDDTSQRFRSIPGQTGDPWPIDRQGVPCQVATAADATIVATECDATIRLLDVATGRFAELHGDFRKRDPNAKECQRAPVSLALTPSGSMLAVGDDCGRILTYNFDPGAALVQSAKVIRVDKGGNSSDNSPENTTINPLTALAFSSDSRMIAAGTADGVLKVMKLDENKMQDLRWSPTAPFDGSIGAIQFNPSDSSTLIVGAGRAAHVLRINDGGDIVHISDIDDSISAVTFSAGGTWAAASTLKGRTHILDLSSRKIVEKIEALAVRVFGGALSNATADETLSGNQRIVAVQLISSGNASHQSGSPTLMIWADRDQLLAKDDMDETDAGRVLALTRHNLNISNRLADLCSCLTTDLEVSGVTYQEVCGETRKNDQRSPKCRAGLTEAGAPTRSAQF
jgi:WD40 repeat protein